MSRIGKLPIAVPKDVKVTIQPDRVLVEGKAGKLAQAYEPQYVSVELKDGTIVVTRKGDEKEFKARHGLYRSLIANMIQGVQQPYTKTLQLVGLGYRAKLEGKELVLEIGFHDPVRYKLPENVKAEVKDQTEITLTSPDKQLVGQVAAEIRALRKPEPYKGTGIRYKDEQIRRKAGKLAAGGGGKGASGG
ncbi:MAG: 50S ribosomal protein L6 [Candidatus Bipolaricaulota bacterium]|nr:50S ribosomal protein L6 [Candidatus Bipolaricaulota bacterium]MCS7275059.1 50S ribosomal protein L6 [Candidatus Bipolaricaulota bacterium]MDW8110387.1 50S ribosomal protein L6 [Candidatus Bipolaricaulota bacterium]MDW8329542.1 50S ribosomal protein L6 [Candidatus Bipolaricaulota bacterium]